MTLNWSGSHKQNCNGNVTMGKIREIIMCVDNISGLHTCHPCVANDIELKAALKKMFCSS